MRTCSVPDCVRVHLARGLCAYHYHAHAQRGTLPPRERSAPDATPDERLRHIGWNVVDDCWVWAGSKSGSGYGNLQMGGRSHLVHRVAFRAWVGPIPNGMVVMHSCDNPPCINPDHLSVGTPADNSADMVAKGRASGRARSPMRPDIAAALGLGGAE